MLLTVVPAAALVTGLAWYAVTRLVGPWQDAALTGLMGAIVVAAVAAVSVVAMTPWKRRPMADWMSWWLAGTVVRLLVTPACAFLLYSAARLEAEPLALSVATAYLVTVLTETAVLARHVGRQSPAHRSPTSS